LITYDLLSTFRLLPFLFVKNLLSQALFFISEKQLF